MQGVFLFCSFTSINRDIGNYVNNMVESLSDH